MIGIPTQVRSEERTLGRLGGILSLAAISGALASQQGHNRCCRRQSPWPNGKATPIPPAGNAEQQQQLTIQITSVEHNYHAITTRSA